MKVFERLQQIRSWAECGARLTIIPSIDKFGTEECELAVLRYCYYRVIYDVADVLLEKPNYDHHETVKVFLQSPFGECVDKELVLALCELISNSEMGRWCGRSLFKNWTTRDVTGAILSQGGVSQDLMNAVIMDKQQWMGSIGNNVSNIGINTGSIGFNYASAYNYLKSSPLFTMSLSSKELFHSNFLAWLAVNYTDLFNEVMKELCRYEIDLTKFIITNLYTLDTLPPDKSKRLIRVYREKNHTDISIAEVELLPAVEIKEKKARGHILSEDDCYKVIRYQLIIENKVKSLPYRQQLEKYVEKLKYNIFDTTGSAANATLLLLTFAVPDANLKDPINCKIGGAKNNRNYKISWNVSTYENFAKIYNTSLHSFNNVSPYEKGILEDYGKLIEALSVYIQNFIFDKHSINSQNVVDWLPYKTGEQNGLRLYDITSKIKYSQLATLFKNRFEQELKKNNLSNILTFDHKKFETDTQYIFIEHQYAPTGPLFGCVIHLDIQYQYVLQVQNAQVNRGIIDTIKEKQYNATSLKPVKQKIKADVWKNLGTPVLSVLTYIKTSKLLDLGGQWYNSNPPTYCLPSNGTTKNYYAFGTFLYGCWSINNGATVDCVIDGMVDEVMEILKHI